MYIDFHKYNYQLLTEPARTEYVKRDKDAYKNVLRKWLEENLDLIVERKWEVSEIHYLKNISDFIKLIREAEQLYEFGFYTGCIALVGVAAEDFLKFLAISLGKPNYESLSQHERLKKLKQDGLITTATHSLLDSIRQIRNDCLHYNQNFKLKTASLLKGDALTALNNLKDTLKSLLGDTSTLTDSDFTSIISGIGGSGDSRNREEIGVKVKNAVSHLLKFDVAFHPNTKVQIQSSIFEIMELDVDYDEISLRDLRSGMYVIVEFPEADREYHKHKALKENELVSATIFSIIDQNGITAEWRILDIDKVESN